MNERIRLLAEQAGAVFEKTNGLNDCPQDSLAGDEIEKFAELIVRECVGIVSKRKNQAIDDSWNVDEAMSMAEMDLEEHFGVKE